MKTRADEVMEAEERRAVKVKDIIERLRDPDVADFRARLLGERAGNVDAPMRTSGANPNGYPSLANMTVTPAIKLIAHTLTKAFTAQDVAQRLRDGHFNFGERKPETVVGDSLYYLARGDRAIFRIVTQGRGGEPNVYERIE